MGIIPSSPGRLTTADALQQIDALLDRVDHGARQAMDAAGRLALVALVVAVARRTEALRAVLVGEAENAKASMVTQGASLRSVLAASAQVSVGEAAGWVYAGKEVVAHPGVREAALAGEVSVPQARAIDRVLGELPETLAAEQRERAETILLQQARLMDSKALARQTRAVLSEVAPEVDAVEDELSRLDAQRVRAVAARCFSLVPDGRGSVLLRGQLPVLEAEPVQRLVAEYTRAEKKARRLAVDQGGPRQPVPTPEQARADGLVALFRDVAARGTRDRAGTSSASPARPGATSPELPSPGVADPAGTNPPQASPNADSPTPDSSCSAPAPLPIPDAVSPSLNNPALINPAAVGPRGADRGSGPPGRVPLAGGERPRLVVTMSFDALQEAVEQAGLLTDGAGVSAGELRRIACDAGILPLVLGGASVPLDVGREQRLVTPEIRGALVARDGGCAFPGCTAPEWVCEAHHIVPWYLGGPTALSNLVLVCPHHHGTVEPPRFFPGDTAPARWQVHLGEDGHPVFTPPPRASPR